MKRTALFIFLFLTAMQLFADANQHVIILDHKGGHRDGFPMYEDMPQAFHNIKSHEIIIDGDGVVSYYNVEISTPGTNTVEISTQVDGTYDTFSISSLPSGVHVITVESPAGHIYEGTFTVN